MDVVKAKLGAETAYVEKVAQADQAEVLSDFARRGFNLVIVTEDSLRQQLNK